MVDLARIGLALQQCECCVIPLYYRPILWVASQITATSRRSWWGLQKHGRRSAPCFCGPTENRTPTSSMPWTRSTIELQAPAEIITEICKKTNFLNFTFHKK